MARLVSDRRSIMKAVTYRLVVMVLDFIAIYLFTGTVRIALGFMVASNIYTTVAYFIHERIWAHISWGTGTGGMPLNPRTATSPE
jgi:uncharacterized membrane protein